MQRLCQIYSRKDQLRDADSRDQQQDADSRDQQQDAAEPRETSGGDESEIKTLSRKDIASGMVNSLLFSCHYIEKHL